MLVRQLLMKYLNPMDEAAYKRRIDQIYAHLDAYTYYELLKVTPADGPDQIRKSFHRLALSMHPDRFATHPDEDLRNKVYAIYKRMTEAYRVLMKPQSRRDYDENLGRGEKRLSQTAKRSGIVTREVGLPPEARKFYRLAQGAERRGDIKTARINYKFAQDLAGDHPMIAEKLKALEE